MQFKVERRDVDVQYCQVASFSLVFSSLLCLEAVEGFCSPHSLGMFRIYILGTTDIFFLLALW